MNLQEIESHFLQYLNICNMALHHHRERMPYKQLLELGEKVLGDRNIAVGVYEENADRPVSYYTIRLNGGSFDVVTRGREEPELDWRVKSSYLEHVTNHAGEYIRHPEKLEWDWLKSRLGFPQS